MDNTRKIRNISKVMQYSCVASAVLLVGFQLYFLTMIRINPDLILPVMTDNRTSMAISEAGSVQFLFAGLIFILPSLLISYAVWHLSRMFNLFRKGSYFSDEGASHLLVFSFVGLVTQLIASQLASLAGTVARVGTESNSLDINITISQQGLVQLLAWGTFFAVAWIMREGIRMAKENAEFI